MNILSTNRRQIMPHTSCINSLNILLMTIATIHINISDSSHQGQPHTSRRNRYHMMTSSNGNILRVTGHLCGEFTALMFSLICAWINGWVNNREACDLRHHRAHYAVTTMSWYGCSGWRKLLNVMDGGLIRVQIYLFPEYNVKRSTKMFCTYRMWLLLG